MKKHKVRTYRRWTPDEKRAIVLESFASTDSVMAIARRHHVSGVSLYLWRKEFLAETGTADEPSISAQAHPDSRATAFFEGAPGDAAAPGPAGVGGVRVDPLMRIDDLERQLADLQAELEGLRKQRALIMSVLAGIGVQLKLLADL